MKQNVLTLEELEDCLAVLAKDSLEYWGYGLSATARLLSHSESAIYLVEEPGRDKAILRINREGYNSANAIRCELAWLHALRENTGLTVPAAIPGVDGNYVQRGNMEKLNAPRDMVLFDFLEGEEPNEDQDLVVPFERLGEVSAVIHNHSGSWHLPQKFERPVWSDANILGGPNALWGDWRAAPAMDAEALGVLEELARILHKRLVAFGKDQCRWGLIHGDLRLANLLIFRKDTRVIDFDDCGFGWYMHDFATALSFIEDHPGRVALTQSWLRGYRRRRALPVEDEKEIPTFIMLRRMQLLAWIGSHSETDLAREQGVEFTRISCELANAYMKEFS